MHFQSNQKETESCFIDDGTPWAQRLLRRPCCWAVAGIPTTPNPQPRPCSSQRPSWQRLRPPSWQGLQRRKWRSSPPPPSSPRHSRLSPHLPRRRPAAQPPAARLHNLPSLPLHPRLYPPRRSHPAAWLQSPFHHPRSHRPSRPSLPSPRRQAPSSHPCLPYRQSPYRQFLPSLPSLHRRPPAP